jgi:hypothetical protein
MSRKNRSTRFTHELEVGTEVVYDQVQGQAVWSLAIELLEKHQPLGVPKSLLPVSDHQTLNAYSFGYFLLAPAGGDGAPARSVARALPPLRRQLAKLAILRVTLRVRIF